MMEETLVKVKKEMLEVAKIIQSDELKIKQALCFDKQVDFFRGKYFDMAMIVLLLIGKCACKYLYKSYL